MEKQVYVAETRIMMSKFYAVSTWVYLFIPFAIMDKEGMGFTDAWPMILGLLTLILLTNYWFFKVAHQQKTTPFLVFRNEDMQIQHPMHKAKTFKYSEIESFEQSGANKIKLKLANHKTHKIHRMLVGNDAFEEVWNLLNNKASRVA